jgi:hypothetical protein
MKIWQTIKRVLNLKKIIKINKKKRGKKKKSLLKDQKAQKKLNLLKMYYISINIKDLKRK